MDVVKTGWISMRRKRNRFFSFLLRDQGCEWRRFYFVLEGSTLLYYRKDFETKPKKPYGRILLRHTYLSVLFKEWPEIGDGYLIHIIPLVVDAEKIQNGLEEAIQSFDPLDIDSGSVMLSLEDEESMTSWVQHILRACALFSIESVPSHKKIALLLQESMKNPLKDFNQTDLLSSSSKRLIQEENISESLNEEEIHKRRCLDLILSTWRGIAIRKWYIQYKTNTRIIQYWIRSIQAQQRFQQKRAAAFLLQRAYRRFASTKIINQDRKILRRRKQIIEELLSTELRYVQGITNIITDFRVPFQEIADGVISWNGKNIISHSPPLGVGKRMITTLEMQSLFSNIDSILTLHSIFLAELEEAIRHWNHYQTCIGDLFVSMVIQFKVYVQYVNNFSKASTLLDMMIEGDSKFASFLVYQSSTIQGDCNGHSLASLLILPVQRLPRYELLLRDILLCTKEKNGHKDRDNLVEALRLIVERNASINESKRDIERMEELVLLQKKFINLEENLILPHRKFLKEGYLTHVEHGKSVGVRHLFLLSDILIVANDRTKGFSSSVSYEMTDVIHLECSDVVTIGEHTFNIGTNDGSISYSFRAESPIQKNEWIGLLKTLTAQRHSSQPAGLFLPITPSEKVEFQF